MADRTHQHPAIDALEVRREQLGLLGAVDPL